MEKYKFSTLYLKRCDISKVKPGCHHCQLFGHTKPHITHLHTMREMLLLRVTTCLFRRSDWSMMIRWAKSHALIGQLGSRDTNHEMLLVGNSMKRMKVRQSCTAWSGALAGRSLARPELPASTLGYESSNIHSIQTLVDDKIFKQDAVFKAPTV